jgi:hypothetical protein
MKSRNKHKHRQLLIDPLTFCVYRINQSDEKSFSSNRTGELNYSEIGVWRGEVAVASTGWCGVWPWGSAYCFSRVSTKLIELLKHQVFRKVIWTLRRFFQFLLANSQSFRLFSFLQTSAANQLPNSTKLLLNSVVKPSTHNQNSSLARVCVVYGGDTNEVVDK